MSDNFRFIIVEVVYHDIHQYLLVPLSSSQITSRERTESARYLRLKNSKRVSKCQSILFYSARKTQKLDRLGAPGGTLSSTLSQIINKLKGDPLVSPSFVWYAKKEQLFWSSSLSQKVQSGSLKFDEKLTKIHDCSRFFSSEKRRLKNMFAKVLSARLAKTAVDRDRTFSQKRLCEGVDATSQISCSEYAQMMLKE